MFVGIDNRYTFVFGKTFSGVFIQMNMSMQHVSRFKSSNEPTENPESSMAAIIKIIYVPGRRMRYQNVYISSTKQFIEKKFRDNFENPYEHFKLCILVVAVIVFGRAAEPCCYQVQLLQVDASTVCQNSPVEKFWLTLLLPIWTGIIDDIFLQ